MRRAIIGAPVAFMLLSTGTASADDDMRPLAWEVGPELCAILDEHPTLSGVIAAGRALTSVGYSSEQAGEVVAYAVFDICPRHRNLLREFVIVFGPKQVA